jgi:adenylate cyclase
MPIATVVFADLTGSTAMYESLGNTKAVELVTQATQWIGAVCEQYKGRAVKFLGDGVLMVFTDNISAVDYAQELQRLHSARLQHRNDGMTMMLKVGLARGEVVEQEGDCFGDVVNIASRLSDLAGPEQVLAAAAVIQGITPSPDLRFRNLGPIKIRGRSDTTVVYQIEWQADVSTEMLTVQSDVDPFESTRTTSPTTIHLVWLDYQADFRTQDLPIYLGRDAEAQFKVNDQRVSRLHAKIDWRGDVFVLEDLSSYGTWVRFDDGSAPVALRRQECVLTGQGELALGASFDDFSVPTVSFVFDNLPAPTKAGRMIS